MEEKVAQIGPKKATGAAPLEAWEGGCSVVCPWHGSRFALKDGRVLDGPSTYWQPSLETRLRQGQIEVRAKS